MDLIDSILREQPSFGKLSHIVLFCSTIVLLASTIELLIFLKYFCIYITFEIVVLFAMKIVLRLFSIILIAIDYDYALHRVRAITFDIFMTVIALSILEYLLLTYEF